MTHPQFEMVATSNGSDGAPSTYRILNEGGKQVAVMYRDGKGWLGRRLVKNQATGPEVTGDTVRAVFELLVQEMERK